MSSLRGSITNLSVCLDKASTTQGWLTASGRSLGLRGSGDSTRAGVQPTCALGLIPPCVLYSGINCASSMVAGKNKNLPVSADSSFSVEIVDSIRNFMPLIYIGP